MSQRTDPPDTRFHPRAWRGWIVLWLFLAVMAGIGVGHLIGAVRFASTLAQAAGEAADDPAGSGSLLPGSASSG